MAGIVLPGGTSIVFEAISPTTGAAITGVAVTAVAVYGYDRSADAEPLDEIPLLTPLELQGTFT